MALFKWELKTQNQSLVYEITMSGGQKELKIEDLDSILAGMDDITGETYMGKCEG